MAIIAITFGSHCHGEEVTNRVSKQLGYRIVDEDLYRIASERYSISRERLIRSLTGPPAFFDRLTKESEIYPACLGIVLAELMAEDNIILTNHPAFMIPGYIAHVLKVCLIANMDYRVSQAVASGSETPAAVQEAITEYDTKMAYASSLFQNRAAYDERLFDMVIAMHSSSKDEAVARICSQIKSEALKTTEKSRKTVEDFLLSATINLAIARAGHKAAVFSENGSVIISINEHSLMMSKLEGKLKKIAAAVPGVTAVATRLGPKYEPPSLNPWDKVDVPPKIMLVDDEKEFVHTLSERLKTRNFESSIAYDGEQALDMLNSESPDVMVLDLMMPGIDGIETLRRVKASHPEVEVIILTGHGSDREKEAAEELGAFAYLRKPVNINELAQKMKEAHARRNRNR